MSLFVSVQINTSNSFFQGLMFSAEVYLRLMNFVCFSAGKPKTVRTTQLGFQKGDIIGVCLDLDIPQISFTVNGLTVKGFFRDFNIDGMFFPAISLSAKIRSDCNCNYDNLYSIVRSSATLVDNFVSLFSWILCLRQNVLDNYCTFRCLLS